MARKVFPYERTSEIEQKEPGRYQKLVVQTDSLDGTLVDTNTAVGAKAGVNSGLLFTLDSLGWADINASLTGCANIRVNFRWHFSTSLAGNPVLETTFSRKHGPGIG